MTGLNHPDCLRCCCGRSHSHTGGAGTQVLSSLRAMVKRQAGPSLTVGAEGVSLTPFADEICLQEDLEVSLVSLRITVGDICFPMCLVAASVGRHNAVRPRTDGIPAWPLHQVPRALMLCSVEMPSGHTLYPFADSPHITQEGFIIHGSNPETRAEVYRLLLHREIISTRQSVQLPTLAGGGCTRIFEQSNSNVT